jgi:hypothetical protein
MKKNAILLSGLVLLFAAGCSNGNTTETENASPATVTETAQVNLQYRMKHLILILFKLLLVARTIAR